MSQKIWDDLLHRLENAGYSKKTAVLYTQNVRRLAEDVPMRSLKFLKDYETIVRKLSTKHLKTRSVYLSAVMAALRVEPRVPHKILTQYERLMYDYIGVLIREKKETENTKSDSQACEWLNWEEVLKRREELRGGFEEVVELAKRRRPTPMEFQSAQDYLILCLYTMTPPRRNVDYLDMGVVKEMPEKLDESINYYIQNEGVFLFNNYKTVKYEGGEELEVPEELQEVINAFMPLVPGNPKFKFLITKYDGTKYTYSNALTKILNRIFGKKVSTSMLRHIYLTCKYGDTMEEQKADSRGMGHSLSMQRQYVLTKDPPVLEKVSKLPENVPKGMARLLNLRERDEELFLPDSGEDSGDE